MGSPPSLLTPVDQISSFGKPPFHIVSVTSLTWLCQAAEHSLSVPIQRMAFAEIQLPSVSQELNMQA